MLDFYHFNNSVCSQKARMVLFEKDLEWRGFELDLFKSEQFNPKYLELNPKGYVPTLIHEGHPIRESTLICEYLDEVFPDPPLMPRRSLERQRVRLWSKTVDEGLFEGVTVFSFSAMFRDRLKKMSDIERNRRFRNIGNPTRRDRHISVFQKGVDSPYFFRALAAYDSAFTEMEEQLEGGSGWLVDGMFTLAEINLAPFFARLEYLTFLEALIKNRPCVENWWQRVSRRPCYISEIRDSLSVKEVDEMRISGGLIKSLFEEKLEQFKTWKSEQ